MTTQKTVTIGDYQVANDRPLTMIMGPCVMESRDHAFEMASALKEITDKLNVQLIYKSSFDKANRSSMSGVRGLGLEGSMAIFADIREKFGCPVITDVHLPEQCAPLAEVVDVLQIPAFLCRQTDLLVAAAKTGKTLHIKKGQFMAPWDMKNVIKKVEDSGSHKIMLCDRGTSFGYNTLITDIRGLPTMAEYGYPIVFDATHSVQQPGGKGTATGGQREFAPVLARAAISVGVAGVFMEVHNDPDNAPSDGPNMVKLKSLPRILEELMAFDRLAKEKPVDLDFYS